MGMSIEEARTALGKERKYALHENKQAFDMAIDTMRKYQKIEQILKDIPYGGDATVRRIQEVVGDGNDKTTVNE